MNKEEKKTFAEKLARWLDERELDQALATEEADREEVIEALLNLDFEKPTVKDLEPGHILLLSEELTPKDADRPIYLAVLKKWEDDHWLFAPYSPYSEPATDKELRMKDEDFGLRVLCLWNSHTAEKKTLGRSWHVGKLDETDRKDALSVFWHNMGMKELPAGLGERVGPVLLHSKDPRRIYLREQLSLLALVRDETIGDREIEQEEEPSETVIDFVAWRGFLEDQQSGRMSASSKDKKPTKARYENRKLSLELTVRSIPRHDQVMFELKSTKKDGHDRLDEFSVELKEIDEPIKSFRNGECVHQVSLAKISFTLIDPQGKAVELNHRKD